MLPYAYCWLYTLERILQQGLRWFSFPFALLRFANFVGKIVILAKCVAFAVAELYSYLSDADFICIQRIITKAGCSTKL